MKGTMSEQLETVQPAIAGRSPGQIAWMRFKRNKVGVAAALVSLTILTLSAFAPIVCRILGIDPNTLNLEDLDTSGIPKLPNGGISLEHPLGLIPGTGRDLLAQLLYGSRISFLVAFLTTALALTIGLFVGIAGGFLRGRVDDTLGRITDFFLAFPAFFMIVALSTPVVQRIQGWGIGGDNFARIVFLIFFLSFFGWPGFSRLIRSQVLSIRERDYIIAAQAMGAKRSRIIMREIIPNIWAPVIVVVSLSLPGYLAAESVYSFLGLGIQPPASTWGILLSNASRFVTAMPSFFLIVAGSLVVVVLAFNLVGDALRDALDPRTEH
jgi:ABC-type dipeptide/oligopeptide/nickel transport system permease subunit